MQRGLDPLYSSAQLKLTARQNYTNHNSFFKITNTSIINFSCRPTKIISDGVSIHLANIFNRVAVINDFPKRFKEGAASVSKFEFVLQM
jgi:hypothetical protein